MSQSGDGEANYEELWGAAADGYNGEGDGFADALVDDLLTFATGGALGAVTKVAKLVRAGNKVPNSASMLSGKSLLDHIFDPKKVDEGHLAPTTQSSRDRAGSMFENITSNPSNKRPDLVTDPNKQKAGIEVYTKEQRNGKIWVETRDGVIQDAGVNRSGSYR